MKDLVSNAKRILAFALVFAMLFSSSAVSVLADEVNSDTEDAVVTVVDETEETDAEVFEVGEAEVTEEQTTEENTAEAEVFSMNEENVGITSDTNGQEICSGLNGISSDASLMRATLTTKFKTRKVTVEQTKYTESYTERTVKVTWKKPKGSTAKYYRLERMKADGTELEVLQSETDKKKRSKRSYTDKIDSKEMDGNATYIYVVTCFDKDGQPTSDKKVAAVASPTVLFAQTADDTSETKVYFALQNGPVNYILERSDKSNKDKYYTNIVADVDVSALNGTEVVTTYNGTPAICVTDTTGDFELGSTHYYRVKAYVKDLDAGTNIESLYSKGLKVKSALPEPELLSITGTHENDEVCYKNGTFRFTQLDVDEDQVAKYSILRSQYPDRGFKAIKTVKASSLTPITVTNLDGVSTTGYEITYNKMTPTVPYYYRVRAIGKKNLAGAMSNPIQNTVAFAPVTGLDVESVSIKQLNVTWKSEGCALKYVVERSGPYTTSPLDGEDTMPYKKRATVSNKANAEGYVTYSDKSGLKEGQWYCYRIYPVNGKYKGETTEPMAGYTRIANPKPKTDGVSLHQINVTWGKVDGATQYLLQRTTQVDANGNPVFTEANTIGTFTSSDSVFKNRTYKDETGIEPYVTYYYRMGATGKTDESDITKAKVTAGYSRPKVVSSVTSDVLNTSTWSGIRVSWKWSSERSEIKSYVVYRSVNEGKTWKQIIEVDENPDRKRSYAIDDGIAYTRGRTYQYKICAVASNGTIELEGKPTTTEVVLPSAITLQNSAYTMKVGETYKIKVKSYSPSDTTFKDITYSIDNSDIVEKSDTGTENGLPYITIKAKKVGKTYVTIKPRYSSGISKTFTVTVTK